MSHKFSEKDKEIFFKLAPEAKTIISNNGHEYPFILRPISHKYSKDGNDFKKRILLLNKDELDYIVSLILCDKEELLSLEEEDIYSFLEIIEEKLSLEKKEEIKNHLSIL